MTAPLVETRRIRRTFPGVVALDEIDLTLHAGECVGLVGKNGAGKSTLIKVLAGVVAPESGEVYVDGALTSIDDPRVAQQLGLTFVHQQMVGAPDLSVAENIELGLGFPKRAGMFVDWAALRARARLALERIGSDIDPRTPLGKLSIAEQRMVMIAHALAQDARLLVLDEPTASLTESEIVRLHEVIRGLVAGGVTVVYVSHRLEEIFAITDRVVVMRDGRTVGESATDAISRDALIELITGPMPSDPHADRPVRTGHDIDAAGTPLLRVRGLGDGKSVHDVDLTLHRGEVLGLAGLVGSGRTEICRLVFGADRATAGEIQVDGRTVKVTSPRAAIAAGIVLVPEDRHTQGVVQGFSVRENITLPSLNRFRRRGGLASSSRARERAAATRHIDDLSIKVPGPDVMTMKLSGGNQQKVVLAKWLEREADVYILDEPTHGIDVGGKREIYALIERLVENGAGVILVSSEFAEIVRLCDRAVVVSEGRLHGELSGDQLTEHAIVDACFAAREEAVASG